MSNGARGLSASIREGDRHAGIVCDQNSTIPGIVANDFPIGIVNVLPGQIGFIQPCLLAMYAKHKSGNGRNVCCLYWSDV